MKNLYYRLGISPDASTEEIKSAIKNNIEEHEAISILQNPLSRVEYNKIYIALNEIGMLRAGLNIQSEYWLSHNSEFIKSEDVSKSLQIIPEEEAENKIFKMLAIILGLILIILISYKLFFILNNTTDRFGDQKELYSNNISEPKDKRDIRNKTTPDHTAHPSYSQSSGREQEKLSTPKIVKSDIWKNSALINIGACGTKYYKVFHSAEISDVYTWEDSNEFCKKLYGHLAVIESQYENSFITSWLFQQKVHNVFFGLTDKNQEGIWKTASGNYPPYLNWGDGEPNNEFGREHYAMFYYKTKNGKWNDGIPAKNFSFICQWDNDESFLNYESYIGGKAHDIKSVPSQQDFTVPDTILGVYTGYYNVRNKKTGLTLTIERKNGGHYAVFKFYPQNRKSNGRNSGEYRMDIKYDLLTDEYFFLGTQWIKQPVNYSFVDLHGFFDDDSLSGNVFDSKSGRTYGEFSVKKTHRKTDANEKNNIPIDDTDYEEKLNTLF